MADRASALQSLARRLRRNQTDAERKLWSRLRARQLNGVKFRRQHPIGRYIVDFCCPESKVVVELDGGHHALQIQADQRRTEFLAQDGYQVLRFWDHEALANLDGVLDQIDNAVSQSRSPSTSPSPHRGEGRGLDLEREKNQGWQLGKKAQKSQQGFTLLELMVVVTIAGILATLAEPSFRQSVLRAKEAALKQNLFTMRDVIDQYRADTGSYPPSLDELTSAGYLRGIPVDPFTKSDSAWQEIMDEEYSGIFDVHSGSELVAINGTPYNEW